jgi:hypothetical protein
MISGSKASEDCRNTNIETDRGAFHRLAFAHVMQNIQAASS